MTKNSSFSLEEKKKLASLLKEGFTIKECAHALNKTKAQVCRESLKGRDERGVYSVELSESLSETNPRSRSGKRRVFTEEEIGAIKGMMAKGLSMRFIAAKMSTRTESIKEKIEEIKALQKKSSAEEAFFKDVEKKLFVINQQIEILFEKVEKLEKGGNG